jgi:Undecaprenyl-phosphate galactose phosphotransferase WbaP
MAANVFLAGSQPSACLPKERPDLAWTTSASMAVADFIGLSIVYWVAVLGRYLISREYPLHFYLELFPCIGFFLAAFLMQGLYPGLMQHPADELRRVFHCITIVFLLAAASTFLWRNAEAYSRSVFLITWAAGAPTVLLARCVARRWLSRRDWWGLSAVVLGSGPTAERIVRSLRKRDFGLRVKGVLTDDAHVPWSSDLAPILGRLSSAPQVAASGTARYAILAMPRKAGTELQDALREQCRGFRHVLLIPDLPGLCSAGICAREVGGELGFEVPQRLFHRHARILKRTLDIFVSTILLILISSLLLIIVAAVKLTSRGPALYGSKRYGRNGEVFKALKFRSMVQIGDEVLENHFHRYPVQLTAWQRDLKLKNDPRITAVGKWLRRFSLDELPQIWNVLRGDMSLVGPRPILEEEVVKYGRTFGVYTQVPPGITGLWQVSGRNNTSYDDRLAFTNYYVCNWSIWLDLYILCRTFAVVVRADGAY